MWDLIVSVPDHCLYFYFLLCAMLILAFHVVITRSLTSLFEFEENKIRCMTCSFVNPFFFQKYYFGKSKLKSLLYLNV